MSKSTKSKRWRLDPLRENFAVLRRLLSYLQGDQRLLLAALGTLVLTALGQALGPALTGLAVDDFIGAGNREGLALIIIALLVIYLVGFIGYVGQIRLLGIIGQNLLKRLRSDIFDKMQELSLDYYQEHETGDLMSRMVNDTDVIADLISSSLMETVSALFGLVFVVVAMFAVNVALALVTISMLPFMILLTVFVTRRSRAAYKETRKTLGILSADLEEDLTTIRETQSFSHVAVNIERFEAEDAANRDANVHASQITAAFSPAIDTLSTLTTVLVALVGGWLAFNNSYATTIGDVVAFISYSRQFFRPIDTVSNFYNELQAGVAAAERIFELLDTPPTITDKPDAEQLPAIEGTVRFDNVVFSYDGTNDVLKGLSLESKPGEAIALVGETGAGKSTIVNLIGRFHDVNGGRVLIDDHDVRDVTRQSLRVQMGEVPQDSFLVADTIANNIRFGKPEATMDEVIAAATAAHAHDFISALPDGYDTEIASDGGSLSQGERQLLCIARAILPDPRLLILDEATANVDTRTERLVQAAIDELLKSRTAFVIAHRLSTIRNVDRILVIGEGHIIEQGSHDELMAKGGAYATLIEKQY
ncbi:MAG: ABC transporter ATP-binding protein [Candidatus Promineifilaceae bacterium]|nr:ABC transporter ATP-binding protein [Candidatus Promineifilaceae bacterium]